MIYYPLSVLMLASIKDILIISTPNDISNFSNMLGDGSNWGIKLSYKVQKNPDGLAQAFIIGEEFIGDDSVCLILGDNIFYGQGFTPLLQKASTLKQLKILQGRNEKLDKLMTEGNTLSAEIQDNRLQMDAAYMRYFVWLGAAITLGLVAMHRAAK